MGYRLRRTEDALLPPVLYGGEGQLPISETLALLHGEKLAICDELEEIADSLPEGLDRDRCLSVSRRLEPLVQAVHVYEEQVLFPACLEAAGHAAHARELVARLKAEHIEDAEFAAELCEGLRRIGEGLAPLNVEALAYMLRGFFAGVRRHIATEREAMLSLSGTTA